MGGGSQSVLAKASDGNFYVLKFRNNPQGPNVLFNEAIGTELFRIAGLLVPEWRPVFVPKELLASSPECWIETENGLRLPEDGWCFGSRFLGSENAALFEILPKSYFGRIRNRGDFWVARALDVLCGHSDNRQAIFVEGRDKRLDAYFFDHGNLLCGADGAAYPMPEASRYLDPRIYNMPTEEDEAAVSSVITALDLRALDNVARFLPDHWKTKTALLRFDQFGQRVSSQVLLRTTVQIIFGFAGRREGSWQVSRRKHYQALA